MRKAFYCSCGVAYVVSTGRQTVAYSAFLIEHARAEHLAEGHKETDVKGAAAARRKAEHAG